MRYSFPRETELANLVGKALFMQITDDARKRAATSAASVYIVRTFHGFKVARDAPPFGEHWKVDPDAQVTHVSGPII